MNDKVKQLQKWFDVLEDSDKKEVMEFLYGNDIKKTKTIGTFDGVYSGPVPYFEGYTLGPPPKLSNISCPKCGHKIS